MISLDKKAIYNRNIYLYFLRQTFSSMTFHRGVFILFLLSLDFTNSKIGLLQGLFFFATFISEIPTGYLGDKYGRKISTIIGYFLILIFISGMIFSEKYIFFLLSFLIKGVGRAFISGSDDALLYDSLKDAGKEDTYLRIQSRALSLSSIVMGLAYVAGGIISNTSYRLVYILYSIAILLSLLTIVFTYDNTKKVQESNTVEGIGLKPLIDYVNSSKTRPLIFLVLGYAIYEAIMTPYFVYGQTVFKFVGLNNMKICIIYGLINLLSGFAYYISERVLKNNKLKHVLYLIIGTSFCLLLTTYFINSVFLIVIFFILNFIPEIFFMGIYNHVQEQISSEYRATLLSIMSFISSSLIAISYLVFGFFFDRFEPVKVISISAFLFLFSVLFLTYYFKRNINFITASSSKEESA